jgi:hypothetical protein
MECPACGVILAKVRAAPPRLPAVAENPDTTFPLASPLSISPYAPPAAAIRDPEPAAPAAPTTEAGEISPQVLEALASMRPWLRFVVGYGFVTLTLMAIAAVACLVASAKAPKILPIALIYALYSILGFVLLLPLRRSVQVIPRLPELGARMTVETFVVEQGAFWRRTGLLLAAAVTLVAIGLILAVLFGGAAAVMKQLQGS